MTDDQMISRLESSRRLGVSEQSVIYWENSGYITRHEDGRRVVYRVAEVVQQAMKNPRLREAAEKLAADCGVTSPGAVAVPDDDPSETNIGPPGPETLRQEVEIKLLRERVEAQEREIERLHHTLQRLAER